MSETNQPNQFSDFFVCGEIFSIFPCILIHISHSVSFPVVFHLLHSITFHSLFNHWICVYPFFLCLFVVFISPVSSQAVRNSYSRFVFCFYFYFSNTTHLALFQICIKHANLRLLTPLSHTIGHWNIDGFHSIFNCHRCVWHIYLWSVYFFKNINETEVVMRNTRDRHTFMVSERVSHNSFLDLFYFLYSLSLCIFLSLSFLLLLFLPLSLSFSFSTFLSQNLRNWAYCVITWYKCWFVCDVEIRISMKMDDRRSRILESLLPSNTQQNRRVNVLFQYLSSFHPKNT